MSSFKSLIVAGAGAEDVCLDGRVLLAGSTDSYIELGNTIAKNAEAGKIAYKKYSNSLEIVGAGPFSTDRKVRVYDSLGIGIDPTSQLHLSGDANVGGNMLLAGGASSYIEMGNTVVKEAAAGRIAYQKYSTCLDVVGAGTSNIQRSVRVWDYLGVGINPTVQLHVSGSGIVTGALAVGGGTTTAAGGISISPTSSTVPGVLVEKRYSSATDRYGLAMHDSGTTRLYACGPVPFTGSSVRLCFATGENTFQEGITTRQSGIELSTNGSERMRIDSTGQVGIGVIPTSQLHVAGSGNVTTSLSVGESVLVGTAVPLNAIQSNWLPVQAGTLTIHAGKTSGWGSALGTNAYLDSAYAWVRPQAGSASLMEIGQNTTGTILPFKWSYDGPAAAGSYTPTERMRMTSDGYMGLGNTNPTQMLSVDGSAYVKGGVTMAGNAAVQGNLVVGNAAVYGVSDGWPGRLSCGDTVVNLDLPVDLVNTTTIQYFWKVATLAPSSSGALPGALLISGILGSFGYSYHIDAILNFRTIFAAHATIKGNRNPSAWYNGAPSLASGTDITVRMDPTTSVYTVYVTTCGYSQTNLLVKRSGFWSTAQLFHPGSLSEALTAAQVTALGETVVLSSLATAASTIWVDTVGGPGAAPRLGIGNIAPAHNLSVSGTMYSSGAVTAAGSLTVGAATTASTGGSLVLATQTNTSVGLQPFAVLAGSKGLAVTANTAAGSYSPMVSAGDISIYGMGGAVNTANIAIVPWVASSRIGLRLDGTTGLSELASNIKLTLTSANVATAGDAYSSGNITASNRVTAANISVTAGTALVPGGISVTPGVNADPGMFVEKRYAAAASNRFGVGQYAGGVTRVYAGNDTGVGQISLCYATGENTFRDALTVTQSGASGGALRVGANNTNPQYTLDVGGTVNATGTLTATTIVASARVTVGSLGLGAPVTKTGSFALGDLENFIICNNSAGATTVTFPTPASAWTGREVKIKNVQAAQTVISNATNVIQLSGTNSTAGTNSILAAGVGKWATLVCDGTNWIIVQAN